MIDFEVIGDVLRKNKIQHKVVMKDMPVISVTDLELTHQIYFIFDRAGNLKELVVVH